TSGTALQGSVPLAGRIDRAPVGTAAIDELLVLAANRDHRPSSSSGAHHPCLGSGGVVPYSADRGKKPVSREAVDELKRQISLLDYLQAHDWQPARQLSRGRWMGLCPLHRDRKPSFLEGKCRRAFLQYAETR